MLQIILIKYLFKFQVKLTFLKALLRNKRLHLQFAYKNSTCTELSKEKKSEILKYEREASHDFMLRSISHV